MRLRRPCQAACDLRIYSSDPAGGDKPAGQSTVIVSEADPLQERAAVVFADDRAADRVSSVRTIRARLHVGQPRAQRVQAYLATLTGG